MLSDNDTSSVTSTLLIGETNFCRSFLFEIAIAYANEGQSVFFFSPKKLESLPAQLHGRPEPSADALQFIKFIYPPTYDELATQLLQLHLFTKPPSMILVDELEHYAGHPEAPSRCQHAARLCCLLLRAAMLCSARLDGRTVGLVCSISGTTIVAPATETGAANNGAAAMVVKIDLESVYARYFDSRWTVHIEANPSTDESQQIVLQRSDEAAAIEFFRLSEAVLVLGRIFEKVSK